MIPESCVVLFSLLIVGVAEECWQEAACLEERDNLMKVVMSVNNTMECQAACVQLDGCQHFTFYDTTVVAGLANSCYLFRTCSSYAGSCSGCRSGPRNCSVVCHPPSLEGGIWSCETNNTVIRDFTRCHYTCSTTLITTTCMSGNWDTSPSTMTCPCNNHPPAHTLLSCTPPPTQNTYKGDTTCSLKCNHNETTRCFNGAWTRDLSSVSCPGATQGYITIICLTLVLVVLIIYLCCIRLIHNRRVRNICKLYGNQ